MTEFRLPEVDDFNGQIIAEFRANGGKVGGPFEGADMLLLHHTGARSAAVRVSPLAFQRGRRDVLWDRQKQRRPGFAQYEAKAAPRRIPVVVLDPVK
jgi:hypothetical protein